MISAQISSSQDRQAACCRMFADGAPGACPDILARRNSQPNDVIRRLNNTGAALKCCAVQD